MNKRRTLLMVSFMALLVAGVWRQAEGGNTQIGRPALPPGIDIAVTTATTEVVADPERRVDFEARLMLGGQPYEASTDVKIRLIEGNGTLVLATSRTNASGVAAGKVVLPTPGKVVIEATCMPKSCIGELTLQVLEKKN